MKKFSKMFSGQPDPFAVSVIVGGLAIFFVATATFVARDLFFIIDIPMYWAIIYFVLVFIIAETKRIIAIGKWYFLLIADELIPGTILTVVASWIIVFFSAGIIISGHGERKDLFWSVSLGLSIALTVLIPFVNRYVVRNKITVINLTKNQIALLYYTSRGNEIVFYEKPVWGKFSYSIIQLPGKWFKNKDSFKGKIKFMWAHDAVSDRMVVIPVTISFWFFKTFKAQDYSSFLPIQVSPEPINLAAEIERMFLASVVLDKKEILNNLQNYLNDRITQKAFMDNLLKYCRNFPKTIFSNSTRITITLGSPEITFERRIVFSWQV